MLQAPTFFSCLVGTLLLAGFPVVAQEPLETAVIEEIIVTATRRQQSISEVSISALAFRGPQLQQQRIETLEDLSGFVPNLVVGNGALTTAISIRGMGSQPERSFEQSAGLYVDGIYKPRSRQLRPAFLDIQQVEVLRGPQAVLFGLNSTAGAVSIRSNRAQIGAEPFATVTADYEFEYGGPGLTVIAGGSPSAGTSVRVAAQIHDRGDYYRNDIDGSEEGGVRDEAIRLSAAFEPSNVVSIDVKYETGSSNFDGDFGEQYGPAELNQLLLFGLPGADDGDLNWRREMDRDFYPAVTTPFGGRSSPGLSQDYEELMFKATLNVGKHQLFALVGYTDLDWDSYADTDASALPIFVSGINESYEQKSIELSWISQEGRVIDYVAGVYLQDGELANHQPNMFDPTLATDPGAFGFDEVFTDTSFRTDADLLSAFASVTWNVSPDFRLIGGARYSDEDKQHERSATCVPVRNGVVDLDPSPADRLLYEQNAAAFFCGTLDGYTGKRNSSHLMSELTIEWNSGDNILWYGKYTEAAKSGGFAAALVVEQDFIEYDDESAQSLEAGMRSRILNGRGSINVTLFHTELDDLQLNAFNPVTGSGFVTNAAEARSRGLEIDSAWAISPKLRLSGSVAFLDATYTNFPDAPCPISLTLAGVASPCDATNETLPRAPEFSAYIGIDFDYPLRSGTRLVGSLKLGYSSEYDVDAALEPALTQDAYTLVGASAGFISSDNRWLITLTGTNLTNEAVLSDALPFLSNIGYLIAPRQVSLQVQYRFGDL